jgi:hypothetical protein
VPMSLLVTAALFASSSASAREVVGVAMPASFLFGSACANEESIA